MPAGGTLGCNPTNPPTDASVKALVAVSDDCSVATTNVSHADTTNGCLVTRTFTITAADHCGNVAAPRAAVFTWTTDTTPPSFTQLPPGGYLGTNPPSVPGDSVARAMVQADDNCGLVSVNVSHVDSGDISLYRRTFTISALDNCGNPALASAVYTWSGIAGSTNDITPPLLSIRRAGSNILLTWPTNASGFILNSLTNWTATGSWNVLTDIPGVWADQFVVTNPPLGPARYYRLKK